MKLILILFLIQTYITFSFAEEEILCEPESQFDSLTTDVHAAANPTKKCPTVDEKIMTQVSNEYMRYFGSLPKESGDIKGVTLKGSKKEIEIAKKSLGKNPPRNWVSAAKGCATVLCAFEKLLKSKEAAMQIFNMQMKSGYVLKLDQSINQGAAEQIWSAREIRELDAATNKLPTELRNLSRLSSIDRVADGYRLHGHSSGVAAYAMASPQFLISADLVIYDSGLEDKARGKSPYETVSWPQEVLTHELCHHHDYKGIYNSFFDSEMSSVDDEKGFKQLSGWEKGVDSKGGDKWNHSKNASFISSYASSAPAEDFAETCMNYVLHSKELEKKAPAKYAYMKKNVFNGAEFKTKPWNNENEITWPKLKTLISAEPNCNTKIINCMGAVLFEDNKLMMPIETIKSANTSSTSYFTGAPEVNIKKNKCVSKMRESSSLEQVNQLKIEPDYCEKGGLKEILSHGDKICAQSEAVLARGLNEAVKIDLKPLIAECVRLKNTKDSCVSNLAYLKLAVPTEFRATINKVLVVRIAAEKKKLKK